MEHIAAPKRILYSQTSIGENLIVFFVPLFLLSAILLWGINSIFLSFYFPSYLDFSLPLPPPMLILFHSRHTHSEGTYWKQNHLVTMINGFIKVGRDPKEWLIIVRDVFGIQKIQEIVIGLSGIKWTMFLRDFSLEHLYIWLWK